MTPNSISKLKGLVDNANNRKSPHLRLATSEARQVVADYEELHHKYYTLVKKGKEGGDIRHAGTLDGGRF